jgi:hypothetical protein
MGRPVLDPRTDFFFDVGDVAELATSRGPPFFLFPFFLSR